MDKAEAVDTLQSVIEVLGCDFVLGYIRAQKEMLKTNEKTPGKIREYIIRETTFPLATGQEVVGELVRCKDCRYVREVITNHGKLRWIECDRLDRDISDSFFCGYGERREW